MRSKLTVACVSAVAAVTMAASAGTLYVENFNDYVYGPDNSGLIPAANNWVIALYNAGGNGTIDAFGAGDDSLISLIGGAPLWQGNGYFQGSLAGFNGGVPVFTRIYNASDFVNDSSVGSATKYVNVDNHSNGADQGGTWANGVWTAPVLGVTDTKNLDPSVPTGTATDGSDWLPVPEPGTMALFAIGAAVVAVRARMKKS